MKTISKQKLDKYFFYTKTALNKITPVKKHSLNIKKATELILDTAQRYYSDAEHFHKKGDDVTAFAALNYAHGWIDAGVRLGLFTPQKDTVLFDVE